MELVRKAFDALHSGESDAFRRYFREDCIWQPLPEWPGSTQALVGHRGIVTIMAEWRESFDDYTASLDEVRDFGDRILCVGEQTATIKNSGRPLRQPLAFVCSDFRDRMIGEVRFFRSTREALEAARLQE